VNETGDIGRMRNRARDALARLDLDDAVIRFVKDAGKGRN